jgi:hypothetical protein
MPSSVYTNESSYAEEPQANPLEPVEHLLHWLTSTTIHLAIGLVIGFVLARAMRAQHLRWTWAAAALGGVVLGRSILGDGLSTTLGTAALCATVRGKRWHREDLDTGADLAEIAAQRRGPLDASRSLLRTLQTHLNVGGGAEPASGSWWRGDRLIVGHDSEHRPVSITVGGASGGTHTLVVGAAGSGKTFTMGWIATRAIGRGQAAIVVDPKGDRGLRERLAEAAQAAGSKFVEWSPQGPSIYNPFARGSETEIADKALAGERYTEPHYLRQAQRYLGHVVRTMRKLEIEVSLQGIVDHLSPDRLELLVRELPEQDAQATHDYLDSLTERQRNDLSGARDRLAVLAESDVGCWLDPRTPGAERVELLGAVRAGAVVYFNLESDRRPLLSQMLGAAIVQDLQTTVAVLQGRPLPGLVAIDEFSAIAPEHVSRLFARARSAGLSMLLGTQELSDLRLPANERLLDQIMGNLSALIAHRQVVPDSAELIASLTTSRGVWRTSRHSDGKHTRTRVLQSTVTAEQIMGLGRGWATVIDLAGGGDASIARILSPRRPRRSR